MGTWIVLKSNGKFYWKDVYNLLIDRDLTWQFSPFIWLIVCLHSLVVLAVNGSAAALALSLVDCHGGWLLLLWSFSDAVTFLSCHNHFLSCSWSFLVAMIGCCGLVNCFWCCCMLQLLFVAVAVCCGCCLLQLLFVVVAVCCSCCLLWLLFFVVAVCCSHCLLQLLSFAVAVFCSRCLLWSLFVVVAVCCGCCLLQSLFVVAIAVVGCHCHCLLWSHLHHCFLLLHQCFLLFQCCFLWLLLLLRSLVFVVVVGCWLSWWHHCFLHFHGHSFLFVVVVGCWCRGCIIVSCGFVVISHCCFLRLCLFSHGCCYGHCFLWSWLIVMVAPSISGFVVISFSCFVVVTGIVGWHGCCCCLLCLLLVVMVIEMVVFVSHSFLHCFPWFWPSLFSPLPFVFGLVPTDTVFATLCAWWVLILHTINSKIINLYNWLLRQPKISYWK